MTYTLVKLGQVIKHRKQTITIDDTQTYMRCRVQSYGKGIVLRDVVPGTAIKTKQQQVCGAGEFLVAEIDAKVGGFGIVPPDLGGAVVSSHYFLFTLDETLIDQRFLSYYVKTPDFQEQVVAKGSTNYAAIRPNDVLEYVIPLPTLDEQRRIVAHIDALAEQIAAARGLRHGALEEAEAFVASKLNLLHAEFAEIYPIKKLRDVVLRVCDMNHEMPKEVEEGIPLVSPLNFTRTGIDYRGAKKISEYDFQRLCRKCPPQRDDILLTRYGAGYGNLRIVETDEPFLASYSIAVITPDQTIINKRYLYWVLVSPHLQRQADDNIRASAMPDLGLKSIREFDLALPPLSIQDQIVAYLDSLQAEVERLKQLQADTAAELDALLPSLLDQAFRGEL